MIPSNRLTKNNLWIYIKSLATEFRKRNRSIPHVELIIVGGGSILLNYDFRDTTTDIDAFSTADNAIREAAASIAGRMNLHPEWINNDFLETSSFSVKLREVSQRFSLLNNGTFDVRTVRSEYLIAMKLNSNRIYKNDFSDVIGVLMSEKSEGNNITPEKIFHAYHYLYEDQADLTPDMKEQIRSVCSMTDKELQRLYSRTRQDEYAVGTELISFDRKYERALNQANAADIINMLKNRNHSQ